MVFAKGGVLDGGTQLWQKNKSKGRRPKKCVQVTAPITTTAVLSVPKHPAWVGVFLGRFIRYCSSFEVPRQQRELLYNTRHTHPHFFEKIVIGGKGLLADSMASEDGKLGVVSLELCWTEHGKTASTLPNGSSSSATTNCALTLGPPATITLRH